MNEFVEECRREWKRLGVPDPVANEMAADLEADLAEAAADGVSPEAVLGTAAFDPRSFAASWAAERGLVRAAPVRRRRIPVALAGFVALAIVGLLLLVATPKRTTRVAFPSGVPHVALIPAPRLRLRPMLPRIRLLPFRRGQVIVATGAGGRNPAWWVGLGALVVGGVGATWSTLALRR
jgi:hypothetical protein